MMCPPLIPSGLSVSKLINDSQRSTNRLTVTLIKKEYKIFLMHKEIQSGAVSKSYIRKGFLINEKWLPES
jgi:hypothetical protein